MVYQEDKSDCPQIRVTRLKSFCAGSCFTGPSATTSRVGGEFVISKRKLTCSGRAANSSCWRCHRHGSGSDRLDRYRVTKVGQAFDQAIFLLVGGTANEVFAAEVLVHRPILEHVVDRGKD